MTKLSVNVNLVAYIRNRRIGCGIPSVTYAAELALKAGASGITVHPRPDERHITRADAYAIREMMQVKFPNKELNVEGYPTDEFLELIQDIKPTQATFVPDDSSQQTSDHGWDVDTNGEVLRASIAAVNSDMTHVSTFVDHDAPAHYLSVLAEAGTYCIEIYTGPFASAAGSERETILKEIAVIAQEARKKGLKINAGHDLNLTNLAGLCNAVPDLHEVSIGHALISESIEYGLTGTISAYMNVLKNRTITT